MEENKIDRCSEHQINNLNLQKALNENPHMYANMIYTIRLSEKLHKRIKKEINYINDYKL